MPPSTTLLSLITLLLHASLPTQASVTCVSVGSTATATWVNAATETCTFSAVVGSNFGLATDNGTAADYSCQGRCGAGCTGESIGDVYTQDCFSHDLCSYFNNSTLGAADANCGAAFEAAEDDFLLGLTDGCSGTNPTVSAVRPTATPDCS